jgi:hypothetical protein
MSSCSSPSAFTALLSRNPRQELPILVVLPLLLTFRARPVLFSVQARVVIASQIFVKVFIWPQVLPPVQFVLLHLFFFILQDLLLS